MIEVSFETNHLSSSHVDLNEVQNYTKPNEKLSS